MNTLRLTLWLKRSLGAAAAFGIAVAIGCASAPGQPHMRAALDELRAARAQLEQAQADKGGHRVRAIGFIDEAIEQVRQGMAYARGY